MTHATLVHIRPLQYGGAVVRTVVRATCSFETLPIRIRYRPPTLDFRGLVVHRGAP
jgi:hypothetical protein